MRKETILKLTISCMLIVFSFRLLGKKSNISDPLDGVTLTVSSDGSTKEEATKMALRSAIEQAFGTFVSANTTILNDKLVKDEIATISSGNIKSYEEISTLQLPNGRIFVSLKAVVSASNLIMYAKSKGSTAELAGATFSMNLKIKELAKQNERIAMKNLFTQILSYTPDLYNKTLHIGEPKLSDDQKTCLIDFTIDFEMTETWVKILTFFVDNLEKMALSKKEREEYERMNLHYGGFFQIPTIKIKCVSKNGLITDGEGLDKDRRLYFRNVYGYKDLNLIQLMSWINKYSFIIEDNTGNISKHIFAPIFRHENPDVFDRFARYLMDYDDRDYDNIERIIIGNSITLGRERVNERVNLIFVYPIMTGLFDNIYDEFHTYQLNENVWEGLTDIRNIKKLYKYWERRDDHTQLKSLKISVCVDDSQQKEFNWIFPDVLYYDDRYKDQIRRLYKREPNYKKNRNNNSMYYFT